MMFVPLSPEEKRVGTRMAVISALVCAVISLLTSWFALSIIEPPTSRAVISLALFLISVGALAFVARCRWPGTISLQSEATITATPAQVWDTIRFKAESPYYKPTVQQTRRLDEAGEVYLLHYFSDRPCPACGLVRPADSPTYYVRLEIIKSQENCCLLTRSKLLDTATPPRWMAMDYEEERLEIVPVDNDTSRVINRSCIGRPTVMMAAMLKLGDPIGQHLGNLKAHLEGLENDTLLGTVRARIAAVRKASRICGCQNSGDKVQ